MKIMNDLIILILTRWSRIYLEFQLCYFTSKSLFATLRRHIFKRQGVDLKWAVVNSVWEVVNSNWENDNSKWENEKSSWDNDFILFKTRSF
jgi:hypothetical protein